MRVFFFIFVLLMNFMASASDYPYVISEDHSSAKCAFDKTFVVGNSISSGLMNSVDFLFPLANYGESPAKVLSQVFNGNPSLYSNISQGYGMVMQTGKNFIDRIVDGNEAADFDTIVGVDMFYMSSVFNTCHDYNLPNEIARLVEYTSSQGKNLVIGTIPDENYQDFAWYAKLFVLMQPKAICSNWTNYEEKQCISRELAKPVDFDIKSLANAHLAEAREKEALFKCAHSSEQYYKDCFQDRIEIIKGCANQINSLIDQHCTSDKSCYKADLRKIVHHLNSGGTYKIATQANDNSAFYSDYGLDELRPNGVNVSELGTHLIVQDILEDMTGEGQTPPICH